MIKFITRFRIPATILFFASQIIWVQSRTSLLELEHLTLIGWMSFMFLAGFWLFLLLDMINNKIYNKTFWLISMMIMPWLAPAVYLFQRKKLLHLKTTPFNRN